MKFRTQVAVMVILSIAAFGGCDDEPTAPTVEEVAGQYSATVLILNQNGQQTDLLADGGELSITLTTGGTTSGRVFLPGAGEGGGDFEADLDGTWTLSGDTVVFDQPDSDTFVEGRSFIVVGDQLRSEGEVDIVLEKNQ